MARPLKKGLDYFYFDVDFLESDEMALVTTEFGARADSVVIRLLCKIFKDYGYYCKWGEDECLLFCKKAGGVFVPSQVKEIVAGCVRRSIFNKEVFNLFGILTSVTIQEKYLRATIERKEVEIIKDFWITDLPKGNRFIIVDKEGNRINRPKNVVNRSKNSKPDQGESEETLQEIVFPSENGINRSINPDNRPESTQSKVNNNKKKILKEKELLEEFDVFRQKYPGQKRGLNTEFNEFVKKNDDYAVIIPLLLPALNNLLKWREGATRRGDFVPPFANLKTCLNQKRWETEYPAETFKNTENEKTGKTVITIG